MHKVGFPSVTNLVACVLFSGDKRSGMSFSEIIAIEYYWAL